MTAALVILVFVLGSIEYQWQTTRGTLKYSPFRPIVLALLLAIVVAVY